MVVGIAVIAIVRSIVAVVAVITRAPVPGIVIPGRIVPGIIETPTVQSVMTAVPGPVESSPVHGVPIPGIPIGPVGIVPRTVVAAQIPGAACPGIVPPVVVVDHGDISSGIVEAEPCHLAFGDDDRVALGAEHIDFGFHRFTDQGIHLVLRNGRHRGCRPGTRIDAVFVLLRRGRVLCHRSAGRSGNEGNQVESQMLFHVRTSFIQ